MPDTVLNKSNIILENSFSKNSRNMQVYKSLKKSKFINILLYTPLGINNIT